MTLKVYQVTLNSLSPIFIGSGKKIGKKDYIVIDGNRLGIVDEFKLYKKICEMNLAKEFETDLLSGKYVGIKSWAMKNNISVKDFYDCIRYELNNTELLFTDLKFKQMEIQEFVKDPYGLPYVPGSSIKGMFRTILLADDIIRNPSKYIKLSNELERQIYQFAKKKKSYLSREIKNIEQRFFNTLLKDPKNPQNAVNDFLQGFIISDSEPIKLSDLTLCQKIDMDNDGSYNEINILRESVKPGVNINFTITVDTQTCSLTDESINKAISAFVDCYNKYFTSKFKGSLGVLPNTVILGGATGFVSKTIIYPILKERAVNAIVEIFKKTGVPECHKHNDDEDANVAPHMIKCTKYKNKIYQIGLATISFQENRTI